MKVLIIDDEPLIRRSLMRAFRFYGHQTFEAIDGISGLQLWNEVNPDLALVDVLMPGLTGVELIQKMKKLKDVKTKIVLMSAFTGVGKTSPKMVNDVDLFLLKPFEDIFDIVKKVEGLANGKQ